MLASTASRLARRLIARAPSHVMIASTSRPRCDLPSARAYGQLSDPNTFELLQGPEGRVIFDNYDARGFAIKGAYCVGGVFAYDALHAAWSPTRVSEITPETLAALEILDPTPDLLIVGTGRSIAALNEETLNYLKELGVAVNASDTVNAISTFNVLVEEGRGVAAAILPAGHVEK